MNGPKQECFHKDTAIWNEETETVVSGSGVKMLSKHCFVYGL